MRNRAKCKLCGDIIESFHHYDYVHCKCGEIAVDGGQSCFKCSAINFENFLRIDDDDNEIPVRIEEYSKYDLADMEPNPFSIERKQENQLSKEEVIQGIDMMIESINNLPPLALHTMVTQADFLSLLLLLSSGLRASDK